jgi:hypothetical protein
MMDTWPDTILRFARHSTDFTVRVLRGLLWPKFELAIRLWLAQSFFVSGALKNVPIGTVMSRLARARAALKARWPKEAEREPHAVR